jgi:hypothetical protein
MTEVLEQPPGDEGDDQAAKTEDTEVVTGVDFLDADELEGDEDSDDEPDA